MIKLTEYLGDAPDPVRDQMMRHDPKFATFFSAYLNEVANFDLQNAFLEQEKQDQLFRMFAHVSLTRDPRAVRDMVPDEVWANTPPDPEIQAMEVQRAELKQGRYRIGASDNEDKVRELTCQIRTRRAEREKRIVKEYREYYFYHRPTWDIEAQARGEAEEEYEEPAIDLVSPERARLAHILCSQRDAWTDAELLRNRIEVIDLMVSFCAQKETTRAHAAQEKDQSQPHIKWETPDVDGAIEPKMEAKLEADSFPLLMEITQCPDCLGDEQLPFEARTFQWCRPTVRNDHFDDRHLVERELAEQRGEVIKCGHPKCKDKTFQHVDHFRNHVLSVHGVEVRTSEQVRQRRQKKVKRRRIISEGTKQRP